MDSLYLHSLHFSTTIWSVIHVVAVVDKENASDSFLFVVTGKSFQWLSKAHCCCFKIHFFMTVYSTWSYCGCLPVGTYTTQHNSFPKSTNPSWIPSWFPVWHYSSGLSLVNCVLLCAVVLLSHRDICPILKDPAALTAVTDLFEDHVRRSFPQVDLIIGEAAVCAPAMCQSHNTVRCFYDSNSIASVFWAEANCLLHY